MIRKIWTTILLFAIRRIGRFLEHIFTRTTITGLENVPTKDGPYIFAGNHASTYDPVLLMIHLPLKARLVGPGDFELLWPGNWLVENLNVILIQRGAADRDSLKQMTATLNAGENLSIFPEGGTWEKRLDDVKQGAAYLSLTTGARVIPVAIGGTYQVWGKIFRLRRPKITLHFLPPMPVVTNADRKRRQADLNDASLKLMQTIYDHLPEEERARYDLHARQQFSGQFEFAPEGLGPQLEADFPVLAELISKPNLVSPLYRNLKLPLGPFLETGRFFSAGEFMESSGAMLKAFRETLPEYISYRLGERKSAALLRELDEIVTISASAIEDDLVMRFRPSVTILDVPLPPNN